MNPKSQINKLRGRIDAIDAKMILLLNRRAICVKKVGQIKHNAGLKIHDAKRERTVLARLSRLNRGPLSREWVQGFFLQLLHEMRALQHVSKKKIMFRKVGIVGLGFLGGSIAQDILARGLSKKVVGYDRHQSTLRRAKRLGIISDVGNSNLNDLKTCDLVVLATPVRAIKELLPRIAQSVDDRCLVIDVGSTKCRIVDQAEKFFEKGNFVGCHPMAGREKSGLGTSQMGLFQERVCFVTLPRNGKSQFALRTKLFWKSLGSSVAKVSSAEHDRLIAATSHLPQVLSTLLLNTVFTSRDSGRFKKFIGNGFRSMTRLAGSDPEMWRQILETNSDRVLEVIDRFEKNLALFKRSMRKSDWNAVQRIFKRARDLS